MRYDSVLLHVCMYLEHGYNSVVWVHMEFPLALLAHPCVGEAGGNLETRLEPAPQPLYDRSDSRTVNKYNGWCP